VNHLNDGQAFSTIDRNRTVISPPNSRRSASARIEGISRQSHSSCRFSVPLHLRLQALCTFLSSAIDRTDNAMASVPAPWPTRHLVRFGYARRATVAGTPDANWLRDRSTKRRRSRASAFAQAVASIPAGHGGAGIGRGRVAGSCMSTATADSVHGFASRFAQRNR
jgi:hypothetical protein